MNVVRYELVYYERSL